MPVQYVSILGEYAQTRTKASVFDTCHMSEFRILGDAQEIGLDKIVTCRLKDMPIKTCRYGFMLKEDGRVIDDLIVFRVDKEQWFIVANAATMKKDEENFRAHLSPASSLENISFSTGKIDLQGPLSRDILKGIVPGIEKLTYYTFEYFPLLDEQCLISRTGYTGELGYEIFISPKKIPELWDMLLADENIKPAGLGARDLLRLEMGYPLSGQDINEDISPLEAGLGRFIDWEKEFIGESVLLKEKEKGPSRRAICFISASRRSPRHHQHLYNKEKEDIGFVTSGAFSPHLQRGIGIGLVISQFPKTEEVIYFGDERNQQEAMVTKRPFYKQGTFKK